MVVRVRTTWLVTVVSGNFTDIYPGLTLQGHYNQIALFDLMGERPNLTNIVVDRLGFGISV